MLVSRMSVSGRLGTNMNYNVFNYGTQVVELAGTGAQPDYWTNPHDTYGATYATTPDRVNVDGTITPGVQDTMVFTDGDQS